MKYGLTFGSAAADEIYELVHVLIIGLLTFRYFLVIERCT